MAIDSTYRTLIIEKYLKEQLSAGVTVSSTNLEEQVLTLIETLDLTLPQFVASDYYVESRTSSSASLFNNTFSTIRQDLRALYKEMIVLTKTSITAGERWHIESNLLEKKLIDLEERIENLLLLIQDVSPQQGIIVDNFTDMNLVDKSITTAEIDLSSEIVQLGRSNTSVSRIFLNDLDPVTDVRFRVRSTVDMIGRSDSERSSLSDPFSQEARTWWTSIVMKKVKPVACEYTVKISQDDPISISKIHIAIHDSIEASPIVITPLYSTDNITFSQLPTNTFTQEVKNTAVFSFPSVSAQWVKFILIKQGPDLSSSSDYYSYQFGFKEISFFNEAFDISTTQQLYSNPLYILDANNQPLEFEKVSLEVCERIETGTKIKYFITTSNDADVPVNSSTVWTPITPVNREEFVFPKILIVGNIEETVIGDNETVSIVGTVTNNATPNDDFELISADGNNDTQTTTETPTAARYSYKNSNDRILNHQIKDNSYTGSGGTAVEINTNNFQLFRNIGEQGLNPTTADNQVREIQRGWRFEDPYYTCVIQIENPEGISINVGDYPIIIDNVEYTNSIDNSILTGKSGDNTGIHKIKVHKNRWKYVVPDKDTLAELKAADSLYPYNHKMLIEGYRYGGSYPDTEEKIYKGADLFAEVLMKQVSPFDIYNNIQADNYDVFAFDKDAVGTHNNTKPTKVIVLKVDEDDPDAPNFDNEKFLMKFTRINQLQKYLRLRADLSTSDTTITPSLYAYKIKLI